MISLQVITKVYTGWLSLKYRDETEDILFLDSMILAQRVASDFDLGHEGGALNENDYPELSVRYLTAAQVVPDVQTEITLYVIGYSRGEYDARYSELTGHLWTHENLWVGHHDLLGELKSYAGRWLWLEIQGDPQWKSKRRKVDGSQHITWQGES